MEGRLKTRAEVPVSETWDLSLIYATEEAFRADADRMKALADEIVAKWKGRLTTPEAIVACLESCQEVVRLMRLTSDYTGLAVEVDRYDNAAMEKAAAVSMTCTQIGSELSFVESEIAEQPKELLERTLAIAGGSRGYLERILRSIPHRLHPEAERVLAAVGESFGTPYDVYNALKLADMVFPSFEADGKTYPLGYSLFEDNYEYEPDTAVRRKAFEVFHQKLREYQNGTAAAYNAYVQHEAVMARLRGFGETIEKDLFDQRVTVEMYHRQIDLIMEKLAPHMRRFAKLLQRIHGLDRMTYADLKLPVDPGFCPPVSIPEARRYVEEGLSVMGEDYVRMVGQAFDERWFDLAQNSGKCTGGFCDSPYGKNSFILMSWHGKMSDVFTMAHELGHAGHFRLCNAAQSIFDTDVSTYFVEAPSTMNEILMAHHLLKTSEDKRFRRWVLANMVSNTYYHNFVTHLLEAAYQREVYRLVQAGGSVQAETLNGIMRDVLQRFWGDAVELVPGSELTWMRQPHYYMGLYSYSYSAGLTVATQMCERIEREGAPAVEDWKKVLTAGGTLTPMELARLGGVDISTDAALLRTIEKIGGYIDEIERLTDELAEG